MTSFGHLVFRWTDCFLFCLVEFGFTVVTWFFALPFIRLSPKVLLYFLRTSSLLPVFASSIKELGLVRRPKKGHIQVFYLKLHVNPFDVKTTLVGLLSKKMSSKSVTVFLEKSKIEKCPQKALRSFRIIYEQSEPGKKEARGF